MVMGARKTVGEQVDQQKLQVLTGERGDPLDHALRRRNLATVEALVASVTRQATTLDARLDTLASDFSDLSSDVTTLLATLDALLTPGYELSAANLASAEADLTYDIGGNLSTVTLSNGLIKTFAYNLDGSLATITLSGIVPPAVPLTKTFTYNLGGELTGITYV